MRVGLAASRPPILDNQTRDHGHLVDLQVLGLKLIEYSGTIAFPVVQA